jgi:hypothetical protein
LGNVFENQQIPVARAYRVRESIVRAWVNSPDFCNPFLRAKTLLKAFSAFGKVLDICVGVRGNARSPNWYVLIDTEVEEVERTDRPGTLFLDGCHSHVRWSDCKLWCRYCKQTGHLIGNCEAIARKAEKARVALANADKSKEEKVENNGGKTEEMTDKPEQPQSEQNESAQGADAEESKSSSKKRHRPESDDEDQTHRYNLRSRTKNNQSAASVTRKSEVPEPTGQQEEQLNRELSGSPADGSEADSASAPSAANQSSSDEAMPPVAPSQTDEDEDVDMDADEDEGSTPDSTESTLVRNAEELVNCQVGPVSTLETPSNTMILPVSTPMDHDVNAVCYRPVGYTVDNPAGSSERAGTTNQ